MVTVPARLEACGLSWAVAARFVLLDLSLRLPASSLTVMTGANGTGKTSLLRLLRGAVRPASGEVLLDGTSLHELDVRHMATRIVSLGHRPGLYLDLSAHENVHLFAALSGRTMETDRVDELLAGVGIETEDRHRPVRGFSRGMLQRTALARVQATQADVWLLDEPATGLDTRGRQVLERVLIRAREDGVAILVATHLPNLAALADQRVDLRTGALFDVQGAS